MQYPVDRRSAPGVSGRIRRQNDGIVSYGPMGIGQFLSCIVLAIAACGGTPPSAATSLSTVRAASCLVLADEEIVSLAWSQDDAHLGVGLRTADGRPAARTVDVVSMHAGELVEDDRMIPESVVVTSDGHLAWLRAGQDGTAIVEATESGERVIDVPDDSEAIQWTAIGYASLQRTPKDTSRILMLDPDRPDQPTLLHETEKPVTRLWVTPDPEWILLTVGRGGSSDESAGFIVVSPTQTLTVDASDADGSLASMTRSRNDIAYREGASGRMVAVSTTDLERRILSEQPVRFGTMSGRDALAVATMTPGEICLLHSQPS
jgi:hypothetical protein